MTTTMRTALGQGLVVLGLCLGASSPGLAAETVVYYHTDALGSPVAETDANGQVIADSRREYESYGKQLTPALEDGPNYTGHVADAATGLVYMQQRYYDPGIGRFLSRDPVTAYDSGDMRQFNAYAYAFNNPYRFTDPDGRQSRDNWYGFNDQRFRDWVHSEKQLEGRGGAQNYSKSDLQRLHKEWTDLGEPRGKGGTSGRGTSTRGQRGFVLPSWLLKANVVVYLLTHSEDLNAGEQEALDQRRQETHEKDDPVDEPEPDPNPPERPLPDEKPPHDERQMRQLNF